MAQQRITKDIVESKVNIVNEQLTQHSIKVNGRNGYYGIDYYSKGTTILINTLFIGTLRECNTYLSGMLAQNTVK